MAYAQGTGSGSSISYPTYPTRRTRREEEEEPAPTRITSPSITPPIVTLTSDTTVNPLPAYNPPTDGGSSGGGGTSGGTGGGTSGGGGGAGTTASPTPTTTTTGGTTSSGADFKALFEALLPYLSPEDRQRLISMANIQGITLSVPDADYFPSYTRWERPTPDESKPIPSLPTPYDWGKSELEKVDPAYLIPSEDKKGMNLENTIAYYTGIMGQDAGINKVREMLNKGIYYVTDPQNVGLLEKAAPPPPNTISSVSPPPPPPATAGTTKTEPSGPPQDLRSQIDALSIIPSELKGTTREYFAGSQRAESVALALENFAAAQGKTSDELGSGYRFLTEIASNLRRFSPEAGPMSRQQYVEFLGQINPLLEQAPSSTYQELGRMLSLPFFSAGNLYNVSRSQDGTYRFGDANKRLFR